MASYTRDLIKAVLHEMPSFHMEMSHFCNTGVRCSLLFLLNGWTHVLWNSVFVTFICDVRLLQDKQKQNCQRSIRTQFSWRLSCQWFPLIASIWKPFVDWFLASWKSPVLIILMQINLQFMFKHWRNPSSHNAAALVHLRCLTEISISTFVTHWKLFYTKWTFIITTLTSVSLYDFCSG